MDVVQGVRNTLRVSFARQQSNERFFLRESGENLLKKLKWLLGCSKILYLPGYLIPNVTLVKLTWSSLNEENVARSGSKKADRRRRKPGSRISPGLPAAGRKDGNCKLTAKRSPNWVCFFPRLIYEVGREGENKKTHTFRRTVLFVVKTMSFGLKGALSFTSRTARVTSREVSRHFLSDSAIPRLLPMVPILQIIFAEESTGSDSRSKRRFVTSRLLSSSSGKLETVPVGKANKSVGILDCFLKLREDLAGKD